MNLIDPRQIIPFNYYIPRDYQIDVFKAINAGIKNVFSVWCRQAGKDTTDWWVMVEQALKHPGNYYYLFPELKEAKRAVWHKIDAITGLPLIDSVPEQVMITKDKVDMFIKLRCIGSTGVSTIQFIATRNDPHSLRGMTPKGVISSEHAYQDPEAFQVIAPAIEMNNAWTIYNTTPNGHNHAKIMYDTFKDDPSWHVSLIQCLYPDKGGYRPLLTKEQLVKAQVTSGMSDDDMAREFGCSWDIKPRGAIFADLIDKADGEGRITSCPYDDYRPVNAYFDLGYSPDATAIWFRQTRGSAISLINYMEFTQTDPNGIVAEIARTGYRFNIIYLPHDGESKTLISGGKSFKQILENLLHEYNVEYVEVKVCQRMPKLDSVNAIKPDFSRMWFDEKKCSRGIDCLRNYHSKYDPKNNVYSKEPVHDWSSHAADALCLMAQDDESDEMSSYGARANYIMNGYNPLG